MLEYWLLAEVRELKTKLHFILPASCPVKDILISISEKIRSHNVTLHFGTEHTIIWHTQRCSMPFYARNFEYRFQLIYTTARSSL